MSEAIRFFAATDVGNVREHNEDNFLVDKKLSLFIVADGMGGHAAGEVASAIAVRTIHEEIKRERELLQDFIGGSRGASRVTNKDILALMEHAVHRACARIHEEAQADPNKRGMGTTLSALLILGTRAFIAHVGDSRIYLNRGARVQQITEDHTVYNELIKRGKLTREQIEKVGHKNAITRAVGVYERVDVDTLMLEVLPGDDFLLCSDGLTGYLETADELLPFFEQDGDQRARASSTSPRSAAGRTTSQSSSSASAATSSTTSARSTSPSNAKSWGACRSSRGSRIASSCASCSPSRSANTRPISS